MEKKHVVYPSVQSSPSVPVNMPFRGGMKKPPAAVKDHTQFASSFLAERGCLSSSDKHKHNAA
jgi:hypothetical protein